MVSKSPPYSGESLVSFWFLASLRFPVGPRLWELARLARPWIRFRLPADFRGFAADALVPRLTNAVMLRDLSGWIPAAVWVYYGIYRMMPNKMGAYDSKLRSTICMGSMLGPNFLILLHGVDRVDQIWRSKMSKSKQMVGISWIWYGLVSFVFAALQNSTTHSIIII